MYLICLSLITPLYEISHEVRPWESNNEVRYSRKFGNELSPVMKSQDIVGYSDHIMEILIKIRGNRTSVIFWLRGVIVEGVRVKKVKTKTLRPSKILNSGQ